MPSPFNLPTYVLQVSCELTSLAPSSRVQSVTFKAIVMVPSNLFEHRVQCTTSATVLWQQVQTRVPQSSRAIYNCKGLYCPNLNESNNIKLTLTAPMRIAATVAGTLLATKYNVLGHMYRMQRPTPAQCKNYQH